MEGLNRNMAYNSKQQENHSTSFSFYYKKTFLIFFNYIFVIENVIIRTLFNGINRFIEKRDIVTFRINVKTLKNIISVADGFESKKQGNLDSTIKDELFFLLILLCLKFILGWLIIIGERKYVFD